MSIYTSFMHAKIIPIGCAAAVLISVAPLVALPAFAADGAFGDPGQSTLAPPGNSFHLLPREPTGGGAFSTNGPVATAAPNASNPADPPAAGSKKGDAKPGDPKTGAPAPSVADNRAQTLDQLFKRLSVTNDQVEAKGIAGAIQRVWLHTDSDTADLLMKRSLTALGAKNYDLAQQLLEKIVIIAPDWAEGWNKLATARYFADDDPGAMEAIDHVLTIEPRHFGALSGMGYILQRSGDDKGALRVFRKVLEVFPQQDDVKKLVQKLQYEVEGRPI